MKKLLTITFSFLLIGAFAQKIDPAYQKMLDEMYENTVSFIQTDELENIMEEEEVYILDTRSPAEYNVSHLKGARLVNYDTFDIRKLEDIPKNAKVILYCSVGWRSERIGEMLIKNGFKNVFNLYGGMFEWYNEGKAVYNNQGETDAIHTFNSDWGKWVKKR